MPLRIAENPTGPTGRHPSAQATGLGSAISKPIRGLKGRHYRIVKAAHCVISKTRRMIVTLSAASLLCSAIVWLHKGSFTATFTADVDSPGSLLAIADFLAGTPNLLVSEATAGATGVVTQLTMQPLEIHSTSRYYVEGRRVSESAFRLQSRHVTGTAGLSLIDRDYKPSNWP